MGKPRDDRFAVIEGAVVIDDTIYVLTVGANALPLNRFGPIAYYLTTYDPEKDRWQIQSQWEQPVSGVAEGGDDGSVVGR